MVQMNIHGKKTKVFNLIDPIQRAKHKSVRERSEKKPEIHETTSIVGHNTTNKKK